MRERIEFMKTCMVADLQKRATEFEAILKYSSSASNEDKALLEKEIGKIYQAIQTLES
jgi:hypothetical protein